jgi:hypothetical protein
MAKQKSRIGRRLWQLVICLTLAKIGSISPLGAQWSSPEPQVDTTNIYLFVDTIAAKEPVYQGPVFQDSLKRRVTLMDWSNTAYTANTSDALLSLLRSGDLTKFDVVYLPWHRIQIVLMQQYLRHPDSLHMDYLHVSWEDDVEFPESLFLAMRDFQKKQPGAIEKIRFESLSYAQNFLNISDESRSDDNSEMLTYPDGEYEWALAVALNSLFPADNSVGLKTDSTGGIFVPTSLRTHVEATRAMVSSTLWDRFWKARAESLRESTETSESTESSDDNSSDDDSEIDPAFGSVPTITGLRDSMPFIKADLENWIPAENREMFRQLLPYFGRVQELISNQKHQLETDLSDYAKSPYNTNKTVMHQIPSAQQVMQSALNRGASNAYEAITFRNGQIAAIAKENGRVLILSDDYRECINRSTYVPNAMPSLLSGLIDAGVKKDDILRVFIVPEDEFDIKPELISNKDDSVSMGDGHLRDLRKNPTLFRVTTDTATVVVSDEPFGLETNVGDSANPIKLFIHLKKYEITDQLPVKTVFLASQGQSEIPQLYDTVMANYDEGYNESEQYRSNYLRGYNSAFQINYVYGINRLKLGALNTVLRSEGFTEIGMIHSQGLSFGLSHQMGSDDEGVRARKMIKNDRLVIAQSSSLMNSNLRSTYVLWYDENEISMGRHFTLGVGGYSGYVRHELKKFTGISGGFINQDQPSVKVVNPAFVYGFSVSPTLRFGNLYARASAGYGWDWGKKTWTYQGSPMNTAGGIKSTGLFMSAEIGYCYRFDFKSKKDDYAAAVDYTSESGTKSNKRRALR